MFVLVEKCNVFHSDYYTGKSYIHQNDFYPCITSNINEAKKYSTKKIAKNSCGKLNNKIGRNFEVEKFE